MRCAVNAVRAWDVRAGSGVGCSGGGCCCGDVVVVVVAGVVLSRLVDWVG